MDFACPAPLPSVFWRIALPLPAEYGLGGTVPQGGHLGDGCQDLSPGNASLEHRDSGWEGLRQPSTGTRAGFLFVPSLLVLGATVSPRS